MSVLKMLQIRTPMWMLLSAGASSGTASLSDRPSWFLDEQLSMRVGLIFWLIALIVVLIVILVLMIGRRGQGNRMSSGRVYSRRREMKARPQRLLDDKYYRNPQNKRKY